MKSHQVTQNLYQILTDDLFLFLNHLNIKSSEAEQFFNAYQLINEKYLGYIKPQIAKCRVEKIADFLLLISLYFRFLDGFPRLAFIHYSIHPTIDSMFRNHPQFAIKDSFKKDVKAALIEKYALLIKRPEILNFFLEELKQSKNFEAEKSPLLFLKKIILEDRKKAQIAFLSGAIIGIGITYELEIPHEIVNQIVSDCNQATPYPKESECDNYKEYRKKKFYSLYSASMFVNKNSFEYANHAFKKSCTLSIKSLSKRPFI